jgi:hypothetical protein
MVKAAKAGIAYFVLIFLAGMILGPVRILLLEPRLGSVPAVLIELPVMLGASWVACGWLTGYFRLPAENGPRFLMGAVAFLLLMWAELGLSLFAIGGTVHEHFRTYLEAAPFIGLLGQLAYAAFPLLAGRGIRGAALGSQVPE